MWLDRHGRLGQVVHLVHGEVHRPLHPVRVPFLEGVRERVDVAHVGELVVVDRQGTNGQVSLRAADDVVDVPVVPVELVEGHEVLPGGRVPTGGSLEPTDRGRLLGVGALSGPGGSPGDEGARAA